MLTVLMPTHNGAGTLKTCLDAYRELDPPHGGWKLVIVDNASTDSTAALVQSFSSSLPVHLCVEPVLGKNAALNAGLREIEGDLVVLTDDDMVPRRRWLTSLRDAADRLPQYAVFGGRIELRWNVPPHPWITECVPLDVTYSKTPPALQEGEMEAASVFGGNMAIRAEVFHSGHRFDPSIGPRADSLYSMGSETEFCRRLERAGLRAWHVEHAVTEHIVRDFQMTPEWILRRAKRFGRRTYRLGDRENFRDALKVLGVPPRLLARAVIRGAEAALSALQGRKKYIASRWRLHHTLGEVIESHSSRPRLENHPAICGAACRHSVAGRTNGFYLLMYHRILETEDPFDFFGVPLPVFEAQIQMLSRHCAVLPLEEMVEALRRNRPLPRRCAVLTFDDGYRDLYTLGMPLLERYRLPATLYAAVDNLDRGFIWPDLLRFAFRTTNQPRLELESLPDGEPRRWQLRTRDERVQALREINRRLKRLDNTQKNLVLAELACKLLGRPLESVSIPNLMLSWDQLRDLARRGLEVGAHTISHPILSRTSQDDCEREVRGSARILTERLEKPVRHFAYPNGQPEDLSPQVTRVVQDAGFHSAATSIAGVNRPSQDLFALRRINASQASVWRLVREMREHACRI